MKWKPFINAAVAIFGILSFLSLVASFAALSDIGRDYASPEVWARAGEDLPAWYSPDVNPCPGEWKAVQISFLILIMFHFLLFTRWIVSLFGDSKAAYQRSRTGTP